MNFEIRYIIKPLPYYIKGSKTIHNPYLTAETVKDKKNIIYSEKSYIDKVCKDDWEFDHLTACDYEGVEITHICDFHGWLRKEPRNIYSYVASEYLQKMLDEFNLYPNQFYNAKVLFKEEYHKYYVWQLFMNGFDTFIDFESTTFCEWDFKRKNKIGKEMVKSTSWDEIDDYHLDNDWDGWSFERLVMKPKFKEMDCVWIAPLGIVISERLKNALEAAQPALTGLEILPCPLEFEYLE